MMGQHWLGGVHVEENENEEEEDQKKEEEDQKKEEEEEEEESSDFEYHPLIVLRFNMKNFSYSHPSDSAPSHGHTIAPILCKLLRCNMKNLSHSHPSDSAPSRGYITFITGVSAILHVRAARSVRSRLPLPLSSSPPLPSPIRSREKNAHICAVVGEAMSRMAGES